MKFKQMLIAGALSLSVLAPMAATVSAPSASATSGWDCSSGEGKYYITSPYYHICGQVVGTGYHVSQVKFTIDDTYNYGYGYVAIVGYGASGNRLFGLNTIHATLVPYNFGSDIKQQRFSETINVNWNFPPTGSGGGETVKIYWEPGVGYPAFNPPDSFGIFGAPIPCHC